MARWSPGKSLVVLGAGATRGAEFIETGSPLCLPPLNADFFTQLQRVAAARHQPAIDGVLRDVLTLYGPDFQLTLEQYFTQLEAMARTLRASPAAGAKSREAQITLMRTRLLVALSAVLEESADIAKQTSPARKHACTYHKQLVESLRPRDTIVSFNYDCVIDHSLRTHAGERWSARWGYCLPNPANVDGYAAWESEAAPHGQNKSINLLKLHGSLNWFPFPETEAGVFRLRERPYKQKGDKLYEIVPPEYVKSVGDRVAFPSLWSKAELAIRRAENLTLIGFSFTPTDLYVESLFRLALARKPALKRVVIVNPSQDDRKRIRNILAPALRNDVRVIQFDRLKDAAPHFENLL